MKQKQIYIAEFSKDYLSMLVEVLKWERGKMITKEDARAIKEILQKYNR